jgi:hypothetical protein
MRRRIAKLAVLCFWAGLPAVHAQEFKVFDRTVQVHGFASQGFVYTNQNNWLTMHSSQGSGAFTDFGANVSMQITDKFRLGAQVYDRNLGNLGEWHPSVDWAFADYRFKPWFGVRGGKVKTVLGLYNDTQDLDFLHTFALLPQSVYPTDLRDTTIAHLGGDLYGRISLKHDLGDLAYTAYAGHRHDSNYSGYAYLLAKYGITSSNYGGLQYGVDLRWNSPLKGLLIGASRMNEDLTDKGSAVGLGPGVYPFSAVSRADWTNQFYGEYIRGRLRINSEYRRFVHDQIINDGALRTISDIRGWYVSGAYRVKKRLELGSYYSSYSITSVAGGPLDQLFPTLFPDQTDTSRPENHIYDKVITARLDLNRFWNIKVEGHFIDGYGDSSYPNGFYVQVNPQGFKANTSALVLKTSVNF